MRMTIRGAFLAAGTLIALTGLVTTAAAEPLAPCVPSSRPTAHGVCVPLVDLRELSLGKLISKSPDCAADEFCVFADLLRSPDVAALRDV
ncbi:hypothetical protein ABZY31_24165 [Streptomyces sp. NPDC006529]|uniref:hypothetical protein n=1 Tax=Streptomyces sp. NPDC006529 TaxID=3157177 RepID=UPI0033B30DD5